MILSLVYLDHAATTMVRDVVLVEMLPFWKEEFGNASSVYPLARVSREAIECARRRVQLAIGAVFPEEIFFTSGGSESDNWALCGVMRAHAGKGRHLITSKIEHKAILNSCAWLEKEGFDVTYLDVDAKGEINLNQLDDAIREDTVLISIMFANNEIGTIEPIEEIGKIAKRHHVLFHVDAVQAMGCLPVDVQKLGVDLLSLSAHKFYGPKGVGALYVKKGTKIEPLIFGGHQEFGMRAGTENVAGIVGLGKALELIVKEQSDYATKLVSLREAFIKEVQKQIPFCHLNGHRVKRHPGNVNFSFEGVDGRVVTLLLAEKGICCSSGSACNSHDSSPSHVLKAIGLSDQEANSTVRFTFGRENSFSEMEYVVKMLKEIVNRLRNDG